MHRFGRVLYEQVKKGPQYLHPKSRQNHMADILKWLVVPECVTP